jgi:hypothetical protein
MAQQFHSFVCTIQNYKWIFKQKFILKVHSRRYKNKRKITQISINGSMDKENVIYTYNGTLFSAITTTKYQ